jgi:hypothetical protein
MADSYEWLLRSDRLLQLPLTVLVASDSNYLHHAIALMRSMDIFSAGFDLVMLLVNPTKADLDKVTAAANEATATSVSVVAHAKPELEHWTAKERQPYFASARFLFCEQLLVEARCPVICMDADTLIVNPLNLQIAALKGPVDVALWRRDLEQDGHPEHMKVNAAVVAFFPTPNARRFAAALAERLNAEFANGRPAWFIDQILLIRTIEAMGSGLIAANLRGAFKDFDKFKPNSVVWSAKGDSKEFAQPFSVVSKILGDSEFDKVQAKRVVNTALRQYPQNKVGQFLQSHPAVIKRLPRSGTFYLPRLDLPWKKAATSKVPPLNEQTNAVRMLWKQFAIWFVNALEMQDIRMDVREIPNWEITTDRINAESGDFAVLPHRCDFDMPGLVLPVAFYMQEYLPSLFTIDHRGWGAGASIYPVTVDALSPGSGESFLHYRTQLLAGNLRTKFTQAPRSGHLDAAEYDIFFPLQIPHDQSILHFSDLSEDAVLEGLMRFIRANNLRMVLKPHPANLKATVPYQRFVDNVNVLWSTDNIHDLIDRSRAVFTLNSSVGFEAMLHGVPIVSFARAIYDAVTIRSTLDTLAEAWQQCLAWSSADIKKYSRFFDWYCEDYAVDLMRPDLRDKSVLRHVKTLLSKVYAQDG